MLTTDKYVFTILSTIIRDSR